MRKLNKLLLPVFCLILSDIVFSATSLKNDNFVKENLKTKNWEPKGKHFRLYDKGYITKKYVNKKISNIKDFTKFIKIKKLTVGNVIVEKGRLDVKYEYITSNFPKPTGSHSSYYTEARTYKKENTAKTTGIDLNWRGKGVHEDYGVGCSDRTKYTFGITGDLKGTYYNTNYQTGSAQRNRTEIRYRKVNVLGIDTNYLHGYVYMTDKYGKEYSFSGTNKFFKDDKLITKYGEHKATTYIIRPGGPGGTNKIVDKPGIGYEHKYDKKTVTQKTLNYNNKNKFLSNFARAVEFSDRVQEAELKYGPFPSYKKGYVNSNSFAHSLTKELGYKPPKQKDERFDKVIKIGSSLTPYGKYKIPGWNKKLLIPNWNRKVTTHAWDRRNRSNR